MIYTDPQTPTDPTPKSVEKGDLTSPNPWKNENYILGDSSLIQLR